jgi:phage terminase large subunit-like protein
VKEYLEWIKTAGFWARETWDIEKGRMKGAGIMELFPHQEKILGSALKFNEEGLLDFETVIYSCPKKSGKTAIAASVGCWYAEEGRPGTEIYVIANTQEQGAGLVFRDIIYHFKHKQETDPLGKKYCKIHEFRIDFPNGTFIQVLAQSFKSVAGSRHALTLWDELWGYTSEFDRRVWDEMVPIPTVQNSLRFITTYAGFENESDLLWEMFIRGIGEDEGSEHESKGQGTKIPDLEDLPVWSNGRMFTYWDHEPRMPWQTEKYLDEQRASERPAAFMRLHMNHWVTSHEEFIPVSWWERATKSYENPATLWIDHPFRYWPITIAVDAGIRRDSTAIVGVGYDAHRGKVGIVFHWVWSPQTDDPIDLEETVEKELRKIVRQFNVASIVYDPTHLITIMNRLKREGLPTRMYEQTLPNMTAASQLLYDLFKNNNLEAYPDDTLKRQIQMAVAETTSRGFRIVKTKMSKRHHIDAAIALAMACYEAVQNGGVDISIPVMIRSPYYDMTALEPEEDMSVPFELRGEVNDNSPISYNE